jgi:superfamily II DNA or RNA helicase
VRFVSILRRRNGMSSQLELFDAVLADPLPDEISTGFVARDYQQSGINEAFDLWEDGDTGVIFRQPTGTGKTVSACFIAQRWLDLGDDRRVMVIAHERQLIWQFADEIEDVLGERPGIEMAQERVIERKIPLITVASRASLLERKVASENGEVESTSRLFKFNPEEYKWLVIMDEAHRYAYKLKSVRHIVDWFDKSPHNKRLGLTATPERGDGTSLKRVFPGIASDYRLYDVDGGSCAVKDGWAVEYDQRFVVVEGVDFKNLREVAGDFDDAELEAILSEREMILSLVQPMMDLVEDRKTLIFSGTVAVAKLVSHTINAEAGENQAVWLDGSVPDHIRKGVYQRHQRGDFQFLSVCGLCREGYNDPGIQAVAVFRPTKSRTLAEQMKGRGCRPLRGLVDGLKTPEERKAAIAASEKPNCRIIDLVGITGMADCASTVSIFAQGKADVVVERANEIVLRLSDHLEDDETVDVGEAVREAQRQVDSEERERKRLERLERERQEAEEARRRSRIGGEVEYDQRRVRQGQGGSRVRGPRGARMIFGKHKGRLVSDVPTNYLSWFSRNIKTVKWLTSAVSSELDSRRRARPGTRI